MEILLSALPSVLLAYLIKRLEKLELQINQLENMVLQVTYKQDQQEVRVRGNGE